MVRDILRSVLHDPGREDGFGRHLDRWLLHPVVGPVAMFATLLLMFQAVFSWSAWPSEQISLGLESLSAQLATLLPAGMLADLLTLAILPGLGAVLVFLPPILILCLFLLLLEGSGYIARLAFLCDTFLARLGLGGHTVFPFLSGFACAIPAIMSARSIPDSRARLATILALPLVPCSARLPVYALVTAAVIPDTQVAGLASARGLTLFALYLLGLLISLAVAATISRFSGGNPATPMELPAYRLPTLRNLLLGLWLRAKHFLRRAGTVIMGVSVVLWGFSEIRLDGGTGDGVRGSLLGFVGDLIHPIMAPLGFTWEMSVALVPGLLAREVAVAALATVHAIEDGSEAVLLSTLSQSWSLATGLAFATWYVFALQCVATLGIIRAETGSWRPVWMAVLYLFALAWLAAFSVYHLTLILTG